MERLENFLKELAELTQKYNIEIGGCGCCGSPYIYDFEREIDGEKLCYNETKQCYELDIVRSLGGD